MKPEEVKDRMRVWYPPARGTYFAGTVDGEPWRLRSGTWVVRLKHMDPAYAAWGKREGDVILAAVVHHLRPGPPEAVLP